MENGMSFGQQFMAFINQYGVIWVAIGLLMATKVGEIVKSFVEDVLTPGILSPVFKKLNVAKLEDLSRNGILWGKFLARVIDFLIVAVIVFAIVKAIWLPTPKPA